MSFPWRLMAVLVAYLQFVAPAAATPPYTIQQDDTAALTIAGARYTVALNELHFSRRPYSINPQPNVESLQKLAAAFALMRGEEVGFVLYPTGSARTARNRRYLVRSLNVRSGGSHGPVPASPQLTIARQHTKKLIPNDPYFSRQWHLRNTAPSGGIRTDVNVTDAWDTWRGSNILVAIVDDGLELTHADLAANARVDASWDFNEDDGNPAPHIGSDCDSFWNPSDCHGTAVGGLVAATANNATGVAGVAFEAQVAGLRLISEPTTDEQDAAAMSHRNDIIHVMNNSWGAEDCDGGGFYTVLSAAGPLMRAAVRNGVENGRSGRGIIYVWAGGNGRLCGDDVNYDGFANLVDVIAVGAVTSSGTQANFSEPGACLITVAPSNGAGQAITTTDLSADNGYNYVGAFDLQNPSYTSAFGGTSAATPIVSGVVALILQANPLLNHRDVKEILLRSGTRVQPLDPDWQTNTAGIVHSHKFGGGLVNALQAITLATNWASLAPRSEITQTLTNLAQAIPDSDPTGITISFMITNAGARVENVALTFTAPHARWGDLVVTLTSPSGVRSRLATFHTGDAAYTYEAWTFNSVRHWGEHAEGTWTVNVADTFSGNTGVLDAADLTLFTSQPAATLRLESPVSSPVTLHLYAAAPGWRYTIDSADELTGSPADWTAVATVTVPTSGRVTIVDDAEATPGRFYRARLVP